MASSSSLLPNLTTHCPTRTPLQRPNISLHKHLSISHLHKRSSSSIVASASSIALPINVDYLEREFSGHGVRFQGIGNSCVVKMGLENGSAASLMLPSGLITSYKPIMWHGATTELLHTTVSEGENGEVVIRGGVSMDLTCAATDDAGLSWSSNNNWALRDVRGSSNKSIQVELMSVGPKDDVQVNCVVTLHEDLLGSEITVTNQRPSSLQLLGSIISHLTVSTPDATYAIGLQGSTYHNKQQPIASEFNIVPPGITEEKSKLHPLAQRGFDALFSGWDRKGQTRDDGEWKEEGEEDDDYAQMTEKMSRIYTCAPREFTVLDRGKRNSVVVRRSGFDEFYVSSPGSSYEWYGKYAYVCIGPSALLKPVILGPESSWTGAQYLYNPNL